MSKKTSVVATVQLVDGKELTMVVDDDHENDADQNVAAEMVLKNVNVNKFIWFEDGSGRQRIVNTSSIVEIRIVEIEV